MIDASQAVWIARDETGDYTSPAKVEGNGQGFLVDLHPADADAYSHRPLFVDARTGEVSMVDPDEYFELKPTLRPV